MSEVSVIVPVYNPGKKLDKCIKSILDQSFKDFELILVNDGSTDNSLDKLKYYEQIDNRVVVIDKENEGCFRTRKRGVEEAKSDYIVFVDADDWIGKEMLKVLYKETVISCSDITVSKLYKVLGRSALIKQENHSIYFEQDRLFNKKDIRDELIEAYFYGHPFPSSMCAKMYKRDILLSSGKYVDKIKFLGEDLYYNLEILLKANKVKVINQTHYYYRLGGFTSRYMPYMFEDMVNGYKIQKEVINEYFLNSRDKQYNGISIMLLNTFKTCLFNLFNSNMTDIEKRERIKKYILNENLQESINNRGALKYFTSDYLKAIQIGDIDFLYELGYRDFKKNKPKKMIRKIASKVL